MAKLNSNLKKLVKEAKLRLISNNYDNTLKVINNCEGVDAYVLNGIRLSSEEVFDMYKTVIDICLSDEFVSNPLVSFINKKIYAELNQEQKWKYMLEISNIYTRLKDKFEKEAYYSENLRAKAI